MKNNILNILNIGNSGIGFYGLLMIAFIVLKLCNVITWSWLLVIGIPMAIPLFFFFFDLVFIIYSLLKNRY